MRNLKRALSLALASVMLLGMMVVGTSAASYPDVDENDNVEAIEVLNAVNVMIGRQGNFEPDEAVNRHEMAVIMAKLVLGVDTADNYVGSHPFTDVVPWADKYVAACYENGLVAGTSATTYGGGNPLTAVQAAAMMLRALGYKDLSVGAQDWRAPVTAMANQIRLFNGVASNPSERLNRNQVAQLALNTLKSPIVNLKDNTISWSNDEGQLIMTGGSREYIALSSHEAYARAINRTEIAGTSASQISGYTVELGEHLYNGKLQLRDVTDVFGRPARHWEYDGKVIGDYAKEELLVKDYVGKVTGKDLYDLLTSDVLDDYELIVHVDGVDEPKIVDAVKADPNRNTSIVFDRVDLNRNNKAAVGATGTGVQTEVYVDHIEHEIYVAIINTYLAIADKDYDTKKEETALTIYGVAQETASKEYVKLKGDKESYKLGVEEFAIAADMAKNDSFLVTLADQEIQTIVPAEVVSGATLSAFKLGDHVVSGGTDYNYTTTATYDAASLDKYTGDGKENLKDRTYDIYLDAYGNLIGLKEIEAKKNYVFISGLDRNGSNLVNRIATANAVFLDGTSETIQINMTKSTWNDVVYADQNTEGEALLNTWCTYTKSGDIYTVKEVFSAGSSTNLTGAKAATSQFHQTGTTTGREADKEFEINLKNLRLDGGGTAADGFRYVYGDSDSVYLTSELDELRWTDGNGNIAIVTGAETVSTGIIDTSITVWDIKGAADAAEDSKVKGTIPYSAKNVAHGVYTLYDKDGIIIAVMAVGEGSAAKDLVYVHSDSLDLESDNGNSSRAAGDGLWTWSRRVIRDGQEVTLTEVGDASEELEFMEQYKWYEVRTDGNGDVIKVTRADIALGNTGRDRFVTNYTKINDTVEETNVTTVLYQTEGGPNANQNDGFGVTKNETLVVKGNNTLAVNTKEGSGIHFRNDVNVVLQYWNRNTKEIDIMAGEGVDDLKDMVDIVNDITKNTDRYNDGVKKTYYVSALIENGLATDIVIFDSYNTYSVNRPVAPTGNARLVWNDVNKDNQYWNLIIPASEYKTDMSTTEIAGWLAQAGCSDISKTRIGWNFTRNGMDYTDQAIVVIPTESYTVTVSAGAGGTASASQVRAETNDSITVTAVPGTGYEVDTVTVRTTAGNSVTVTGTGNTRTFTMPAANVTVTVTFKAAPVVGEKYTVTFPEHTGVSVDGTALKSGDKVEKGTVITVEPIKALKVEGATTPNALGECTVTGNVVVTPKTGFQWSKTFEAWVGVNADTGDLNIVPFGLASSMFRFARAVEDPAGTVIDTTVDGWCAKMIRDVGATYTIEAGGVTWTATIGEGETTFKLTAGKDKLADGIAAIDDCVVTKTAAATETPGPTTPTGDVTLTLKGAKLVKRDIVLDEQPVAVFAGPKGGKMERVVDWKLGNTATSGGTESVTANYTIPAGYEVMIRPSNISGGVASENDGVITGDSIWLVDDEIPVFLNEKTWDDITLTVNKDTTVEIKDNDKVANGVKVQKITVGEGVKGTWTGSAATPNGTTYTKTAKALTTGVNYVYDGAGTTINFTDNGAGSKIIDAVNGFLLDADSKTKTDNVYDAEDSANNSLSGVTVAHTFSSAILVDLVGASVEGKVNGTKAADNTSVGSKFDYVAVGKELKLSGGSFDGYILNAKAGTPIKDDVWTVAPVGADKDVIIYGGVEIVMGDGVTAQWAPASTDKSGIALKNGDCAILNNTTDADGVTSLNSYIINVKTSVGTHVGQVAKVYTEGYGDMTDIVVSGPITWETTGSKGATYALESFTRVTLYNGPANDGTTYIDTKAAGWGFDKNCGWTTFYDKDAIKASGYATNNTSSSDSVVFYVRTGAGLWLKVDGAKARTNGVVDDSQKAIVLSVYAGGKEAERDIENYYVTFQATGNEPISVRPFITTAMTKDQVDTIENNLSTSPYGKINVLGDGTIEAKGNYQYLGGDPDFNDAHQAWTVAGDLSQFIRQAYTDVGSDVLYYNGTQYIWDANGIRTGVGQYVRTDASGNKVTIIADVVKDCGYDVDELDGKEVTIIIGDYTFTFVMVLDNTLTTNMTTGKQE